jgi:Raf kinase inhibitor-like YbhB/YbcL family protein
VPRLRPAHVAARALAHLAVKRAGAIAALVVVLAACSSEPEPDSQSVPLTQIPGMTLSSPDITGGEIPVMFTCNGDGTMPALRWSGVPASAVELAIDVRDPDAPSGDFLHLAMFGIDPKTSDTQRGTPPPGAHFARNDAGTTGWTPPCPPSGTHRYRFTLYALSSKQSLPDGISGERFQRYVMAHGIGTAGFEATYAHR